MRRFREKPRRTTLFSANRQPGRKGYRSRNLLRALICQGLLNHQNLEKLAEEYGTGMPVPADYTATLISLAATRVRLLLSALMEHPDYCDKGAEGNLSFLRSDKAFAICMGMAHERWGWVHKKLA